jgi:hypothetical protein
VERRRPQARYRGLPCATQLSTSCTSSGESAG